MGHLALGYILGKASARGLKTSLNIPLVLTLSVIPDVDILLERLNGLQQILPHRGPLHSIVVMLIVFVPILAVYGKKALPYLIALVQHSIIGDYLTGGNLQLLWPITSQTFGTGTDLTSVENLSLELMLFFSSIALLVVSRDLRVLFKPRKSNLLLALPTFTVLLPAFLSYPLKVPVLLIFPHLVYVVLFLAVILVEIGRILKRRSPEDSGLIQEHEGRNTAN